MLCNKTLKVRYICLLIYNNMRKTVCQGLRQKKNPPFGGGDQTTTAGVVDRTYSRSFSGVDHS